MGDEGVISLQRQGKITSTQHLRVLAAGTCALLATLVVAPAKVAAQSTGPADRIVLTNPSQLDADRSADQALSGGPDESELETPRPIQTFEQPKDTVLIEADEMVHDREVDVVTARGNVEVTSDSRVLLADSIVYDRGTKTVTANGNVSLLQPDGQVMFADSMVLSDDFSDAVGETVRLLLEENARIAANSGTRRAGNRTELKKAVYTVCDVCE
ncbi:MAG: LptA/OstA family protein, partial [Pseudomonadota bacterium]